MTVKPTEKKISASKAAKKKKARQLRLKGINGKIKPTPQQILIAKELIKPGVKKGEALIAAGVTPGSARSNSAEICAQPGVRAAIAMACQEAGVTIERIARKLDEGMDAKKVIEANLLMQASGEIKKVFTEVDDYPTQHQYTVTSIKLLDLFPAERTPGAPDLPLGEEKNMIERAEAAAAGRDVSRYMVKR